MTLQEFAAWANGKRLAKYNDGEFPGQCVSLVNQYCWRVIDVPANAWGNAYMWASTGNAPVMQYFDHVSEKQAGDILVYPATAKNGDGHIEIYIGNGQSLEQNRMLDYTTHISPVWFVTPIAILRSKKGVSMALIQDVDNEYYRWAKGSMFIRGRMDGDNLVPLTRDEFRAVAVGREWLTSNEILEDDVEAENTLESLRVGKIAQRDNWKVQISTLQTDLRDANAKATELGKAVNIKQGEIDKLTAQLAAQSGDTQLFNQLGEVIFKLLVRVGLKKG